MPTVNLTIRNNTYQIACDAGEEEHLRHIASILNKRINVLSASLGKASDLLLLVMTALMMEDEINELKSARYEASPEGLAEAQQKQSDEAVAETIDAIAEYIETIAHRLENA